MSLTDSKKRDFVMQMGTLLQQNATLLTDKGFDPTAKIAQLQQELLNADEAEAKQLEAMAAAKDATTYANNSLDLAYTTGSATVDLLSGLLGKTNNLVLEIKKLRKSSKSKAKPTPSEG